MVGRNSCYAGDLWGEEGLVDNKKKTPKTRFFYVGCCELWSEMPEVEFSYYGKMSLFCYKHGIEPAISYLFWKGGLTKEEFAEFKKKQKGKNET